MPSLVPGIHVRRQRRWWPGQARPWRAREMVRHDSLADLFV